jgi:hypothetical protein
MDRLLALYRAALRSGDHPLAAALVRVLRRDRALRAVLRRLRSYLG